MYFCWVFGLVIAAIWWCVLWVFVLLLAVGYVVVLLFSSWVYHQYLRGGISAGWVYLFLGLVVVGLGPGLLLGFGVLLGVSPVVLFLVFAAF